MLPNNADVVIDEFKQAVTTSCAIHGASLTGIRRLADDMVKAPRSPKNPDPTIAFSDGDPNLPTTRHAGRVPFSRFMALAAEGGLAEQRLGHQLVVFVYTIWESEYRPKLASALQVPPNNVEVPILGDLRRIRNDVVHNRGIASADHTAKCVELRWFSAGDPILVRHEHIIELDEKVQSLIFTTC